MPAIVDVYEIADSIRKAVNPDAILLFGSVARKGSGEDVDLLVVSRKKDRQTILKTLYPFYKKYSIDVLTVSRGELKKLLTQGSPFLRKIQKEGRLIYMKGALKYWRRSAEEDLRQAEYLLEGGFYRGACYSAQQAAEKIIKCFLLSKGWELEKTHKIRRLLAIGQDYGLKLKLKDKEIDFMDSIYTGRYPGEEGLLPMGAPTKRDAKRAVRIAHKVFSQVIKEL